MLSIVVIVEDCLKIERLADSFASNGDVTIQSKERFLVEYQDDKWIAFDLMESTDEFLPSELEIIHESIQHPVFWLVTYSEPELANLVILSLPDKYKALVCNDYDVITPVKDIRLRIECGDCWLDDGADEFYDRFDPNEA